LRLLCKIQILRIIIYNLGSLSFHVHNVRGLLELDEPIKLLPYSAILLEGLKPLTSIPLPAGAYRSVSTSSPTNYFTPTRISTPTELVRVYKFVA
jgi:hypothetical protein